MAQAEATLSPPLEGRLPWLRSLGLTTWMWFWVALGLAVVLIVAGFLIAINSNLTAIDGNLVEATAAVNGAGSDVEPLPGQLSQVNETLTTIDGVLKPIPGHAGAIIGSLTSIRGNLDVINPSLKDTSGVLTGISNTLTAISGNLTTISNTAGAVSPSLVDTSNVLTRLLGLVRDLKGTLAAAYAPGEAGTQDILARLDTISGGILSPLKGDTGAILSGLVDVNGHLERICQGLPQSGKC